MQFIGLGSIIAWVVVTAGILFAAIKYTIGMRVPEQEEDRGLDLMEHGLDSYPDFGPTGPGIFSAANGN